MSLTQAHKFVGMFFPSTLRGHGSKRRKTRCVQAGCKGVGTGHRDRGSNEDTWREEHGLYTMRDSIARDKQKAADKAAMRLRGKYLPAPRVKKPAPFRSPIACTSCGHKPSGKKNDEGLTLTLCGKCWRIGHTIDEDRQESAA